MGTTPWNVPSFEYFRWRFGIPSPIWIRNLEVIRQLIDKLDLHPISEQSLPPAMIQPQMMYELEVRASEPTALRPRPFPGGLKFAHLHYEGRVYSLTRPQWEEFSGRVIADFKATLERTKAVSFGQLVELDEVIASL